MAVLIYSAIMTVMYMMLIIMRAFFPIGGYQRKKVALFRDPSWRMILPLSVFAIVIVLVGVHADPLLDFLQSVAFGAM